MAAETTTSAWGEEAFKRTRTRGDAGNGADLGSETKHGEHGRQEVTWKTSIHQYMNTSLLLQSLLQSRARVHGKIPNLPRFLPLHPFFDLWQIEVIANDVVDAIVLSCDWHWAILIPPGLVHTPVETDDVQS